jgi:hypothetical protein
MITVTENNYNSLENIPHVSDPVKKPDVVFYPSIFSLPVIDKIEKVLSSAKYKKGKLYFADDPELRIDKKGLIRPFPPIIDKLRSNIQKVTGYLFNACLISNKWNSSDISDELLGYDFIIPSIYIGKPTRIVLESNIYNIREKIDLVSGSLVVERESVINYWEIIDNFSESFVVTFMHVYKKEKINECLVPVKKIGTKIKLPYDLSLLYLKSRLRHTFGSKIKKGLSIIHSIPEGQQCFMKNGINDLRKYIKIGKLIGTGDWGNVYSACLPTDKNCRRKFAIKMSRITRDDFDDPYTETSNAWYEIWILKDILKPLVELNICPNLPLYIDTFLCDNCDFIFRKGDNKHPCVITVIELASSDLKNYLKFGSPSDDELFSSLFQIMSALHAIQMSGQILNNDIKSKNILVYDVKPGGYWHYKIGKNDFYVPNYGKLFVLNDYGVSTLYDPNFQLYPNKKKRVFNLGSRLAINVDGIFSPINTTTEFTNNGLRKTKPITWYNTKDGSLHRTSYGGKYKIDRKTGQVIKSNTTLSEIQKSYLFRKGVTTNSKTWGFFEHPYIIPPFEFYNDLQDVLRTFVGGKRTTQKGDHILYPSVSENVIKKIKPYMGLAENSGKKEFSLHTYHVLAGEFITKFFTETHNYQKKPNGKKISYFDMNKCIQSKQS